MTASTGAARKVRKPLAVTVKETLELTHLGHSKVYELIKDGRLRSIKVGSRTLILFTSIERLLGIGDAT